MDAPDTPPPSTRAAGAPASSGDATPGAAVTPDAHVTRGRLGVLRHAHFRLFWFASLGSYMGNWFEFIGTQWIVAKATDSTLWLAYIGAAQLLPTLVLGLLGGVVADRVNRRTLLVVTQALMMLIALAFFGVVVAGVATPMVLLFLSLAQGVVVAFNNPAWQVLIPRLVPREDLVRAITLQGIGFNTARALGPALAGVIMGLSGPSWLFLVNAVSFVGVMVAVSRTPDAPAPTRDGRRILHLGTFTRDMREAGAFIFREPGPRAALLAMVVFATFATPILRFLPLFVTQVYQMEEATFGLLTGVMGVGAVAGGLLLGRVPAWYPKHHFIPYSILMGGLWILLFSIVDDVRLAGVYMFFVGVFWMWTFNSSMAALQLLTPDAVRGRVMAVCNAISLGLMPTGAFIASGMGHVLAQVVDASSTGIAREGLATQLGLAFVSMILVLAGIVMLIWRTPEIDGLKPGDPGYDRQPGFLRGVFAPAHRPVR